MDDNQIVDLFMARDESAITYAAEKYGKRLRSISMRITEDLSLVQECENDTYLQAWNLIPPNEPREYLSSFLSRIIRNISINRCVERSRKKRSAKISELTEEIEECIPSTEDIEKSVEDMEIGRMISDFLRRQPEEKRIIFMHRYYYLDSVSAIAKRFGYSQSKIKTMLFRLRADLRDYLIKEGYNL